MPSALMQGGGIEGGMGLSQAFIDSPWEALSLGGVDWRGQERWEQGVGVEGRVGRITVVGM